MTTYGEDIFFSNFKCSLKLTEFNGIHSLHAIASSHPASSKIVNNFLVLKQRWVFVIFSNGFVNVTKIKNLQRDVIEMRQYLSQIIPSNQINFRVENLTGTCKLSTGGLGFFSKLVKFQTQTSLFIRHSDTANKKVGVEYDFTSFPAIKIFTSVGVGLVFSNAKLNIVGCKTISDAYWIRDLIQRIVNESLRM